MVRLFYSIFIFTCICVIFSCTTSRKLEIIDPIDTKIRCNNSLGDTSSLNIVLYDSSIKEELNGFIVGTITFDTIVKDNINHLIIENFEPTWLRLKNSVSNQMVFNQHIDFKINDPDYKTYNDYITQLLPIIMSMKCWVVYFNQYYPPTSPRISMMFPFKVIPSE